jgi:hypothetical protein
MAPRACGRVRPARSGERKRGRPPARLVKYGPPRFITITLASILLVGSLGFGRDPACGTVIAPVLTFVKGTLTHVLVVGLNSGNAVPTRMKPSLM